MEYRTYSWLPSEANPLHSLPLASISLGLGGLLAGARSRHFSKTGPWLRRTALGVRPSGPTVCRALATEALAAKVLAESAEIRAPPGDPRQYLGPASISKVVIYTPDRV